MNPEKENRPKRNSVSWLLAGLDGWHPKLVELPGVGLKEVWAHPDEKEHLDSPPDHTEDLVKVRELVLHWISTPELRAEYMLRLNARFKPTEDDLNEGDRAFFIVNAPAKVRAIVLVEMLWERFQQDLKGGKAG
jgi:hypothetical protein